MTIDEAIRHCGEVAEEQEKLYRICPLSESEMCHCDGTKDCRVLKNGKNKGCKKCAEEHRQLAGWLEELKDYRDKNKMVVRVDVENKDYIVQLVNTVAKIMIEVFENLTIEDVNMFQLGYNKAIDDIKEKLMQNGFIYTQHALDVFNEIAEQLKAGRKE